VVEDVPDVVEVEEVTETPDVPDIQDVKEEVPEPEPVPEEAIEVLAETPPIVDPTPAFVPPVLPTKKPKEPERVKQKVVEPQTPKAPADPKTLEKRQVAEAPKAPEPVSKTEPTASQPPAPSSARGSQGKSGSQDSRDAGNANAQSAGGNPGSTADYIARLQAWLARHKEYPRSAQKRGQQGTALLFFVIDRQGHVINHNIRKSSGYRVLDKEVSEMIERAQPLPRIPDDLPMQQMQLVLPVQFTIQK
jgi:protein TonB